METKPGASSLTWSKALNTLEYLLSLLLKVVIMLFVTCGLLQIVAAHFSHALGGPSYETPPRYCIEDRECDVAAGEGCYWLYDGCQKGRCMCDPKHHRKDPNTGECRPLKLGNEKCVPGDICPAGMYCRKGVCTCEYGNMTSDGLKCLASTEKLLGEECNPSNKCLQRAPYGYTNQEVHCSVFKECTCREGFKPDGVSCRKWRINEIGCTKAYHCEGGAICDDNRCVCPSNYRAVAGNKKCAKRGAVYDLPIGSQCNEMHERRYCAANLVCHKCGQEKNYTCVKFLIIDDKFSMVNGSSKPYVNLKAHITSVLSIVYILHSWTSR